MTNNVEATKRVNVEALNHTALKYVAGKEEEELTDGQELFISLLEGDDKKIEEKLETYVFGIEYLFATNGGEPDLKDVLALKLLERIKGEKYYPSMIYQDFYLEHIGIKYKGKEKEG